MGMDGTGLIFDAPSELWLGSDGKRFIRNEFHPENSVWIDVTTHVWSSSFGGVRQRLDWSIGGLPDQLISDIQQVVRENVRTKAPTWGQNVQRLLSALARVAGAQRIDLSDGMGAISAAQWAVIWEALTFEARTMLRSIYRDLVDAKLQGASHRIALEMQSWVAWPQPTALRDVVAWDSELGAYTSAEAELARRTFVTPREGETAASEMTRVWGWMLFETYKRPSQLLGMTRDALVTLAGDRPQHFLRVPKVKAQTGDASELWPISAPLAKAIGSVSERPVIRALQTHFDRLVVLPGRQRGPGAGRRGWLPGECGIEVPMEWHSHGRVPSAKMHKALEELAAEAALISPRTGRQMTLGAKRIRHTGGTRLAMQGTPMDDIQTILEHDDPSSAQADIDAVASELVPAIERADRALGGLFAGLNAAFFQGKVAADVGKQPVFVPDFSGAPAVVGACGSGSACPTNPFWACYGGCPHFQAWREADHARSLTFVAREHGRWSAAEAGKERSKLGKDFERTFAGIQDVIAAVGREAGP